MPCGVGRVPTGAGLVDGGVDQGPWLGRKGLLDGASGRRGKGSGGGCMGFGSGGVGGRGTGPRGRSKFRNVCVQKEENDLF